MVELKKVYGRVPYFRGNEEIGQKMTTGKHNKDPKEPDETKVSHTPPGLLVIKPDLRFDS